MWRWQLEEVKEVTLLCWIVYMYWYSVRITAVELDIFFNGWDAKPCFFSAGQLYMIDVDSKGLNKILLEKSMRVDEFCAWFVPVVPFSSVTTQHSSLHQWQLLKTWIAQQHCCHARETGLSLMILQDKKKSFTFLHLNFHSSHQQIKMKLSRNDCFTW